MFHVPFLDLEDVATLKDDIVIELIPESCCGQLRAWELRQRTKVNAANSDGNEDSEIEA